MSNLVPAISASEIPGTKPGAWTSIATASAAAGDTTITFSSIPATYTDLHFRILGKVTAGTPLTSSVYIRLNGDTATNYTGGDVTAGSSAWSYTNSNANTVIYRVSAFPAQATASNYVGCGTVDILNYAGTTLYKTVKIVSSQHQSSTVFFAATGGGTWKSTAAVNSVSFTLITGTMAVGTKIALYGIKAAS